MNKNSLPLIDFTTVGKNEISLRVLNANSDSSGELDLFDLSALEEGSEESTEEYAEPGDLRYLRDALRDLAKEVEGEDLEAVNSYLSEVEFAYNAVPYRSGKKALFLLGDFVLLYGEPGFKLSNAIYENSESDYEVSAFYSAIAFIPIEDDEEAITEIVTTADERGVSISPRLRKYSSSENKKLLFVDETSEKAKEIGIKIPESFPSGRSLKEHQEKGALALAYNNGGLLADQVGLGKGGEFINAWEMSKAWIESKGRKVGPVIVTVKKNLLPEMVAEIQKWVEDPNIVVLEGRKASEIPEDVEYILLNYDILAARVEQLKSLHPSGFISDESHVYKNEEAKRSKAASELSEFIFTNNDDPFVLLASGTPFVNSPRELYSVLSILGAIDSFTDYALARVPKKTTVWFRNYRTKKFMSKEVKTSPIRAFEIYFCGGYYDRYHSWINTGASHVEELNKLLIEEASMVRRRKSDVISPLPPVTENAISSDLNGEYLELYREVQNEFYEYYLERAKEIAREEGISEKKALREAYRKLTNAEKAIQFGKLRQVTSSGKAQNAIDWIDKFLSGVAEVKHEDGTIGPVSDDPTRRKLIVFVHYRDSRQAILDAPELQKYNPLFLLPTAEQSGDSIQEAKALFQEDNDDHRLIICSMAAREGHTLTAAKDVAVVDIPFSPDWVVQMIGRAWARISEYEPHEAYAHYFVAPNTIDAKTLNRVRLRKATFDAVIDLEGTEDDIQEIEESIDDEVTRDILEGAIGVNIGL